MHNKMKSWKLISIYIVGVIILLIMDLVNIGRYIPFVTQINYQFWNLIIVIALFAISYHYIDSRTVKRNEAQERTGKLLIAMACDSCIDTSKLLDSEGMREDFLKGFDGNKPPMENKRFTGLHNLPFSDDNDIKKLAYEGIVKSEHFELYLKVKKHYHNMISMFYIAPDEPSLYQKEREEMINTANKLKMNLNAS